MDQCKVFKLSSSQKNSPYFSVTQYSLRCQTEIKDAQKEKSKIDVKPK